MTRIHTRLSGLAVLALSGAVAACAPGPQPAGPQPTGAETAGAEARACFFMRQVHGFSEGPRERGRIYLRAGVNDAFQVDALGACPELDWSEAIGLDRRFGGSSRCVGDTIHLVTPARGGGERTQPCLARVTRKLSDDERRSILGQ